MKKYKRAADSEECCTFGRREKGCYRDPKKREDCVAQLKITYMHINTIYVEIFSNTKNIFL